MRRGAGLDRMTPLEKDHPVRSCISCRRKGHPSTFIRLTLVDGKVIPDIKGGAPGRGAWLHSTCAEVAIDRGALRFAFKQDVAPDVSELLNFLGSVHE